MTTSDVLLSDTHKHYDMVKVIYFFFQFKANICWIIILQCICLREWIQTLYELVKTCAPSGRREPA